MAYKSRWKQIEKDRKREKQIEKDRKNTVKKKFYVKKPEKVKNRQKNVNKI